MELAGGRFSPRKAIDYAMQIAQGLAAAHDKGIVHRDLKPENLFVTKDGRVKILDFGLAKLTQAEGASSSGTNLPTETRGTEPGVVLGTLGYMSPEQVKGKPADARSDIFAFGAVLYEMLSGKRAFQGDSAAETISAILREDPPDLSVTNKNISPGLERIVRHCLEKNPERRFQSASDIAFDLEALSGTSGSVAAAAARLRPPSGGSGWPAIARARAARRPRRRRVLDVARLAVPRPPTLPAAHFPPRPDRQRPLRPGRADRRLRGLLGRASPRESIRCGPAVPSGLRSIFRASCSSRRLALGRAGRVGSSRRRPRLRAVRRRSRACRSPGGSPARHSQRRRRGRLGPRRREPRGRRTRSTARLRLEYPIGKVLYESSDRVESPRISPRRRSDRIRATIRSSTETLGSVMVVDPSGPARALSGTGSTSVARLVAGRAGDLVLGVADGRPAESLGRDALGPAAPARRDAGFERDLWTFRADGKGSAHDTDPGARSSRACRPANRRSATSPGSTSPSRSTSRTTERHFSSRSGAREAARKGACTCVGWMARLRCASARVSALSLSPDGQWVIARLYTSPPRLVLLPTGAGEPKALSTEGILVQHAAVVPGRKADPPARAARRTASSPTTRWTSEAARPGRSRRPRARPSSGAPAFLRMVASCRESARTGASSCCLSTGASRARSPESSRASPRSAGAPDGRFLYVVRPDGARRTISRVDSVTGRRESWKEFRISADPVGLITGSAHPSVGGREVVLLGISEAFRRAVPGRGPEVTLRRDLDSWRRPTFWSRLLGAAGEASPSYVETFGTG